MPYYHFRVIASYNNVCIYYVPKCSHQIDLKLLHKLYYISGQICTRRQEREQVKKARASFDAVGENHHHARFKDEVRGHMGVLLGQHQHGLSSCGRRGGGRNQSWKNSTRFFISMPIP